MEIEKYSRTELELIKYKAEERQQEINGFLASSTASDNIKDALRNQRSVYTDVIQKCNQRLQHLFSSCIFCKERVEVERSTITHICQKCDDRILGGRK